MQKFTFRLFLILLLVLVIALVVKANPAEYLNKPSFTGDIVGWTVVCVNPETGCDIAYDGTYCQDSAGSLKGATGLGKKVILQGSAEQTIATEINSADTVTLSLNYHKRSVISAARVATIKAQIAKPSTPTLWDDIWSNIDIPAANGAPDGCPGTGWTATSSINVSNYFNENGTYKFRWYFDLESAAGDNQGQALAWIDNTSLDVSSAPSISIIRTVGDGSIAYGNVGLSGTKNTGPGDLGDIETYRNNGTAAELFRVKTSTATGGTTPWTVGSTINTDVFVHSFATTTGLTWQILDVADTYETASSSVAVDATVDFYFKIDTPSGTTVYDAKTITVNVQAIEAP